MAATTRISWLLLGTAFGLGCASSITPLLSEALTGSLSAVSNVAENAKAPAEQSLEEIVAATPNHAKGYDTSNQGLPLTMEVRVKNGDTLMDVLRSSGISRSQAYDIITSVSPLYNPRDLTSGDNLTVHFSKDVEDSAEPSVKTVEMPISMTSTVKVARDEHDGFNAKQIDVPVRRTVAHAGGVIESSMYQTGVEGGLPPALVSELINAYSYDVDFQRDIKQGNNIDVLFERIQSQEDGSNVGHGNVIFAELGLSDRTLKIYRYVNKDGTADYYNAKGESVRKALLRTPINGAKITSGFGMRNHPLLGYTKMHRGVDFGAASGTPIYAAGDGQVEFVGRKGTYGNYVRIKHNNQYSSAYAHISRFAAGMKIGKTVKQGQVIAYVGSTGASTGPHLHYEIMSNNTQVNPSNVKFKTGNILQGKELASFQQTVVQVEKQLASAKQNRNTLAMADTGKRQLR